VIPFTSINLSEFAKGIVEIGFALIVVYAAFRFVKSIYDGME
jgi:hypothetical protein